MRPLIGVVLAVLLAAVSVSGEIRQEALLEHIKFLASDDLRGRANGSEGLERAADYVAAQFKAAGLEPAGRDGGWFQPFELNAGLLVGRENTLTIEQGGKSVRVEIGKGYYPMAAPASDSPAQASTTFDDLPLVFAGYGLVVPSLGYDDYRGLDVAGKAVLIFSHEPQEQDPGSRLNGTRPVAQTTLQAKAAAARERGARALIVIADPVHRADDAPYALFAADPDAEQLPIPVLRVRRDSLAAFIDGWQLDAAARLIDKDLVPRSRALPGVTVDYREHLARNRRTVRNIVGVLRGSDPARAGEAVVIGAHYDHVGIGGRLSVTPDRTGEIHNGADDNASGTAAIIEMARTAAAERTRFPRTLIFVAFAGEERGLLGSARYMTDPTVPAGNIVAMLNLDMVGRARGGVDISGLEVSPSMEADLKAAVEVSKVGLSVHRQGPGAGRSDDSSFIDYRIPAVNFFTGFHDDYHAPGDDWQKIDAAGTRQVATLALELAAQLAARRDRPEFNAPRR